MKLIVMIQQKCEHGIRPEVDGFTTATNMDRGCNKFSGHSEAGVRSEEIPHDSHGEFIIQDKMHRANVIVNEILLTVKNEISKQDKDIRPLVALGFKISSQLSAGINKMVDEENYEI